MRKRKDYRLPPQPMPSYGTGIPHDLVVRFLDATGKPAAVLDLSAHAGRARMAADFAHALRWHMADKSDAHRQGAQYQLAYWFRFLDAHDPDRATFMAARDVDRSLLQAHAHWLDQQPLSRSTRAGLCSVVHVSLTWLRRNRPDLVQADLEIPRNLYPYKESESQPREALCRAELEAVLAACRKDIEASWADFERGRMLIAKGGSAIVGDVRRGDIDLRDLSALLAFIAHRHGGVIPRRPVPDAQGKSCWLLAQAIRRHGGNQRISRFLHATAETVVPYMIVIAAQTFANPEALRCFGRDCLSEHVFLDGRALVTWEKGRSNTVQRRSFLRNRSLSVPNLIDRVLAMTAPLVSHSPPGDRDKLFLTAGVLTDRRVRLVPSWAVVNQVHRFAERHDLRTVEGAPLDLTLASLRATGLTLAHAALGGDVAKTQVLANHANPEQTRHYISQPMTRADQAAALAHLQGRFVEAVRCGSINDEERQAAHVESSDVAAGGHSLNASASGFLCTDPLGGVAPGQRKGRLCTAWLACFTCPNAVIPLDADTLARLMRTRAALIDARSTMVADRWMLLYAPKLEILEHDVLPRFSAEMHRAALAKLDEVPAMVPSE